MRQTPRRSKAKLPDPDSGRRSRDVARHETTADRAALYCEFLDYFYRVHYRLGMNVEAAMCDCTVSRTQAAVLWLIAAETGPEGFIRRKQIELRLHEWFKTSNSNVSKLLRELAQPPLRFISQTENPRSGREKLISLTPAGYAFTQEMKRRGFSYFETALEHLNVPEMEAGAAFFSSLFSRPPPAPITMGNSSLRRAPARSRGTGR